MKALRDKILKSHHPQEEGILPPDDLKIQAATSPLPWISSLDYSADFKLDSLQKRLHVHHFIDAHPIGSVSLRNRINTDTSVNKLAIVLTELTVYGKIQTNRKMTVLCSKCWKVLRVIGAHKRST